MKMTPFSGATVETLTGGFVNFVCRAFLESAVKSTKTTVIVKRFAASSHNSDSYEVERTALWLCNTDSAVEQKSEITIRVPRLLAFDDASRTIVMEDCGIETKMLSEWLLHLESDSSPTADIAAGWPELTADAFVAAVATFFGALRATTSAAGLLADSRTIAAPFDFKVRTSISDVERRQWFDNFAAQALSFGVPPNLVNALAPTAPASSWPRRVNAIHDGWDWSVTTSHDSNFSPADHSLIVGDLWPNSVLVDAKNHTIWIVDWEAADVGRSGRDVALLIDHLWIMTQNPSKYDATRVRVLIRAFENIFCPSPRKTTEPTVTLDWRRGREPEFLRSVAMFGGIEHYELDHPTALRSALDDIAALAPAGE